LHKREEHMTTVRQPSIHVAPGASPLGSAEMSRSYLLWLAEVDEVACEAKRIAHSDDTHRAAEALTLELRVARAHAEREAIARKAFRFTPSEAVHELALRAVVGAREQAAQRRIRIPAPSESPLSSKGGRIDVRQGRDTHHC
jgi:hypothetical protein